MILPKVNGRKKLENLRKEQHLGKKKKMQILGFHHLLEMYNMTLYFNTAAAIQLYI